MVYPACHPRCNDAHLESFAPVLVVHDVCVAEEMWRLCQNLRADGQKHAE